MIFGISFSPKLTTKQCIFLPTYLFRFVFNTTMQVAKKALSYLGKDFSSKEEVLSKYFFQQKKEDTLSIKIKQCLFNSAIIQQIQEYGCISNLSQVNQSLYRLEEDRKQRKHLFTGAGFKLYKKDYQAAIDCEVDKVFEPLFKDEKTPTASDLKQRMENLCLKHYWMDSEKENLLIKTITSPSKKIELSKLVELISFFDFKINKRQQTIQFLLGILKNKKVTQLHKASIESLGKLKADDPKTFDAIINILNEDLYEMHRLEALKALKQVDIRDSSSLKDLSKAIFAILFKKNEKKCIQEKAIKILSQLPIDKESKHLYYFQMIFSIFLSLFASNQVNENLHKMLSLAKILRKKFASLLVIYTVDVEISSHYTEGSLENLIEKNRLIELSLTDPSSMNEEETMSFFKFGGLSIIRHLEKMIFEGNKEEKVLYLKILGSLGLKTPDLLQYAKKLLANEDLDLKYQAAMALVNMGEFEETLTDTLIHLSKMPLYIDPKPLIKGIRKCAKQDHEKVRLALIAILDKNNSISCPPNAAIQLAYLKEYHPKALHILIKMLTLHFVESIDFKANKAIIQMGKGRDQELVINQLIHEFVHAEIQVKYLDILCDLLQDASKNLSAKKAKTILAWLEQLQSLAYKHQSLAFICSQVKSRCIYQLQIPNDSQAPTPAPT